MGLEPIRSRTRPSNVPVCQFQHYRKAQVKLYLQKCDLSTVLFAKWKNSFCSSAHMEAAFCLPPTINKKHISVGCGYMFFMERNTHIMTWLLHYIRMNLRFIREAAFAADRSKPLRYPPRRSMSLWAAPCGSEKKACPVFR